MPDWWRPLGLDLDGDRLARRRQGVEALRQALSVENVVNAVAYAHGDLVAGVRIIGTVRAAARSADGAFAGDVGDAEPPAIVAAALTDQLAVDPGSELSTAVSLLVLSAAYGGHRPAIDGIGLADYASHQLDYRAASSRRVATLAVSPPATRLVQDALAAIPQAGAVVIGTAVGTALSAHAALLVQLAARLDETTTRAAAEHAVLREALSQQTWLLESWCETADRPWSEVPAEARALIAALELAARTHGSAPAIAAESLLASILSAAGSTRALEPVAGVGAAGPYLEGKLSVAPNAILFPIATALAQWRDGQRVSGWEPPAPAETALDWDTAAASETPPIPAAGSIWDAPVAPPAAAGWDTPAGSETPPVPEATGGWDAPVAPADQAPAPSANGEVVLSLQAYREALVLRVLGHE